MKRPDPTGHTLEFEAGELFFSTTDERGHIDKANDVFVRLSRYEANQLKGAPHNIIRHPDMPSGVFRLLWESVEKGQPFAGYIRNLSADGSHYDVFATVTPLPEGGYLSVRSKPMSTATFDDVFEAYAVIVAEENKLREQGRSAREVAGVGAKLVDNAVRDLGYDGYDMFQRKALLREVMLREEALEGTLGMVVTNTIDLIVRAALGIHAEVSVLSFDQETLETIASYTDSVLRRIRKDIDLQAAAELGLWDSSDNALRPRLNSLTGELSTLAALSRETQFQISLARLQAAMVTQFADERFEIEEPAARAEANSAIRDLVSALLADLDVMLQHIGSLHVAIHRARTSIESVSAKMHERRELVDNFLDESFEQGTDLSERAAALEPHFSQSVIDADVALSRLERLAKALHDFDVEYDAAPLERMREQLLEALENTEM